MMGWFERQRYRISAALSPNQMGQQMSRVKPMGKQEDPWLKYKDDKLGYEDYDKMMMDPQIKSGIEMIRMFLLSRKLIITPASEEQGDIDIAQEIEDGLNNMDYPIRKVRNDMYSALVYGYSVSEVIWGLDEESNQMQIKRLRPIPIDTITDCFEYDDNGNLETISQDDPEGGEEIEIPAEKCLVYTYDEKFGDRRGTSILDAVYDNWFMKQKILQWWNVYLQKHEGPTLAAYIDNPAWKMEAQDMMDDVREGRANVTLGSNDRLEVIESQHRGEGFTQAVTYHDTMIYRKMNIGTLIMGQADNSGGAYAQSNTQMDSLNIFLDGIHEDIAAELQAKVDELCKMNWDGVDSPKVAFETFEEKDLLGLLNALKPMIDAGAIDPQDQWFRQVLADVVNRYTDVDTSELLDEEQQIKTEVSQNDEGKQPGLPTPQEQEGQPSQEQADMLSQVQEQIKPKE